MELADIARRRLFSQHIVQADFTTAHEVVSHMGAMQAQDYGGALWSVALRTPDLTVADIEKAIENREIVRTWPMRGTLHFVAAEDARWMLELMATRKLAAIAGNRRQLGFTDEILQNAEMTVVAALSGGNRLAKSDLLARLAAAGIATDGQRGVHILNYYLAQKGIVCLGPREGKQPTYVLLDEWLPPTKPISREEALGKLAKRYFCSHGPATLKDFAGWGFLTMGDAKLGLELAKPELVEEIVEGTAYWFDRDLRFDDKPSAFLLPGFDEFMLGYKNHSAALEAEHANKIVPGNNGMFMPTIVMNGQVVGTWKKTLRKSSVAIEPLPFFAIDENRLESAVKRYGKFLGVEATTKTSS